MRPCGDLGNWSNETLGRKGETVKLAKWASKILEPKGKERIWCGCYEGDSEGCYEQTKKEVIDLLVIEARKLIRKERERCAEEVQGCEFMEAQAAYRLAQRIRDRKWIR